MSKSTSFGWALLQSAWAALLALLLVPLYLHYVGIDGYGLIGFFTSLQALVLVFDLGLTPAISRETARLIQTNEQQELHTTVRTLEVFTLSLTVSVGVCLALAAPSIAHGWLQSKTIAPEQLQDALLLMALIISIKWPIGFYHGILIGAERLALSSQLHLFFTTLAGLGSIAVLALLSPTVIAFFMWNCCVTAFHLIYLRLKISEIFVSHPTAKFSLSTLRRTIPFSIQMAGVAATGLVFTQMDRLLLSKMLSLDAFAAYAAAALLASGLHIVVGPVFNSIYPKFVAYIQSNSYQIAAEQYKLVSSLLLATLAPAASFLALNAHFILQIWTGNSSLSESASPVLAMLVMGYAINGVMYPAYALQLAYGRAKIPLLINLGLSIILAPLLYLLIARYGVIGAGISWLCVSVVYLFLGTWITWRFLELPVKWKEIFLRLMLPAIGFLLLTCTLFFSLQSTMKPTYRLFITAVTTVSSSLIYLFVFQNTRTLLITFMHRTQIWIRSFSKKNI